MEKSRGIGFSGVFLVFFFSAENHSHQNISPPFDAPPTSTTTTTLLSVLFTHPSIHPSLSLITTLSLSPSIVGLLLSLVEFQPFSLRFFFKFHNFFVCFEWFFCLFWVFFCLFVAPPLPADFYKDLKAERNELKEPPHPFPVLKKKNSPKWTSIRDLMDSALGAPLFISCCFLCVRVRTNEWTCVVAC